jgi:ATP-dependent exoDNAse (exonuclease V) alpha subunit
MDEAGMTDSISMAKIMVVVKQAGAKLVLVGDQAQLQPVGPGAIFRALLERLGFAELTTIRRQKEAWQREATFHFAAGNTEKALGFYQEHGQIHLTKTSTTALELLVDDWHKVIQRSSVADHLILAYLNADVDQLNQMAREKIISQGGCYKVTKFKQSTKYCRWLLERELYS